MLAQDAKGNLAVADYKNILWNVKHGSLDLSKIICVNLFSNAEVH